MKLLIGLVGEKGGGKETFTKLLEGIALPETVAHTRTSDLLGETLRAWNLPVTRTNLQHLAIVMDDGFGKGTLTHAVAERVKKFNAEIIVVDGVRWLSDEKMIRSFPHNLLIYITADLDIRYKRIHARREKLGEDLISREQFVEEEKVSTELEISSIGRRADITIDNKGSIEDFKVDIEKVYNERIKKFL